MSETNETQRRRPVHDGERVELPRSPRSGSSWELEVDDLATDGRGIAYLPAAVGPQREPKDFRFHVRKAVPGDRVRAVVERRRGEEIDAHVGKLLEPSGMRIEPRCPHFGRREVDGEGCGGCTLQSLSYRHQLAAKERAVKSFVRRAGLDPGRVHPVVGQDDPWYYRNKMEFSFGDTAGREFALGLHPTGYRHEIVNLEECHLQSEFSSRLVPSVRQWAIDHGVEPYINSDDRGFLRTLTIREGERTGERLVDLMTTHDSTAQFDGDKTDARAIAEAFGAFVEDRARAIGGEVSSLFWTQKKAIQGQPTEWIPHRLAGKPVLEERLELPEDRSLRFEIGPRAFFQTNTPQAETLYAEVLEKSGLLEEESGIETALDLYCGTGTIGLCLAPYAGRVVGVEMQDEAVENARDNAGLNGIDNAEFFCGDVADVCETDRFRDAYADPDLVVVDPPRAGLQPEAREQVVSFEAPRMVYVSCNPETLARDLGEFEESGYRLRSIQPIDMFPQTYHIECVAKLVR